MSPPYNYFQPTLAWIRTLRSTQLFGLSFVVGHGDPSSETVLRPNDNRSAVSCLFILPLFSHTSDIVSPAIVEPGNNPLHCLPRRVEQGWLEKRYDFPVRYNAPFVLR